MWNRPRRHVGWRPALTACVITCAAAGLASPGVAQEAPELEEGTRVRLTVTTPQSPTRTFTGTWQELARDTLRVRMDQGGPEAVHVGSIRRLEVWDGTSVRTGRGALIGGASGGLAIGLVALISEINCDFLCVSPAAAFAGGFAIGLVPGVLVGALVGSLTKADNWREHTRPPLDLGLRLQPTPDGPHLTLGVTLRR